MLHTTKEIDELSVPGGPTSSNKGAETSHPSSYMGAPAANSESARGQTEGSEDNVGAFFTFEEKKMSGDIFSETQTKSSTTVREDNTNSSARARATTSGHARESFLRLRAELDKKKKIWTQKRTIAEERLESTRNDLRDAKGRLVMAETRVRKAIEDDDEKGANEQMAEAEKALVTVEGLERRVQELESAILVERAASSEESRRGPGAGEQTGVALDETKRTMQVVGQGREHELVRAALRETGWIEEERFVEVRVGILLWSESVPAAKKREAFEGERDVVVVLVENSADEGIAKSWVNEYALEFRTHVFVVDDEGRVGKLHRTMEAIRVRVQSPFGAQSHDWHAANLENIRQRSCCRTTPLN